MTPGTERAETAGYEQARASAAYEAEAPRGLIALDGPDAISFLHGILTNDIAGLAAGHVCYAAWLTPQGRMQTDMHVLRTATGALLDLEPAFAVEIAKRLDLSLFNEQLTIADRTSGTHATTVHGPQALETAGRAIEALGGDPSPLRALELLAHASVTVNGSPVVAYTARWLGVTGVRLLSDASTASAIVAALKRHGTDSLSRAAASALRIEAGMPLFGVDMTTDTIPLEAGIQSRAISMTKGCYVGQEVIVRILHRGHGRVVRRLVGLTIDGADVPGAGTTIYAEAQEAGSITSAAWSPGLGKPVALGYVHRDSAEPGTRLHIGSPDGPHALVSQTLSP
jgi:folate-binding protein YgfZ